MSTEREYRPLQFVDKLEGNNHILLLFDDQKYANLVIFRYLSNGLKKGESCILFAPDNPVTIESAMRDSGIDVDLHKNANTLRVYQIDRSNSAKVDTLATLRKIRDEATRGMKPPFRFAGRTITDIETLQGMKLGIELEHSGQANFESFECSQLCYYDIDKIEPTMRQSWISGLLKNHHHVIYASDPGKAVAFETDLLEQEA